MCRVLGKYGYWTLCQGSVNMVIRPLVLSLKHGSDTSVKKGFMASQTSTKASSVKNNRSADHSSEPELLNRHHRDSLTGWCLTFHIKEYCCNSTMSTATAVDSHKHVCGANCIHTIGLCTSHSLMERIFQTTSFSGWRKGHRVTLLMQTKARDWTQMVMLPPHLWKVLFTTS